MSMKNQICLILSIFFALQSPQNSQASAIAFIDQESQTFVVQSHLLFYGALASNEIIARSLNEIKQMWNEPRVVYVSQGREYPIEFRITAELQKPFPASRSNFYPYPWNGLFEPVTFIKKSARFLAEHPEVNAILITQSDPMHDNRSNYNCGGQYGKFLISDDLGNSTTAAHEFGHGLGLGHVKGKICQNLGGPSIMCARGSITTSQFQYNSKAAPGSFGGTLNPYLRKVTAEDILSLELEKIPVDHRGIKIVGPHLKKKCWQNKL